MECKNITTLFMLLKYMDIVNYFGCKGTKYGNAQN